MNVKPGEWFETLYGELDLAHKCLDVRRGNYCDQALSACGRWMAVYKRAPHAGRGANRKRCKNCTRRT